MGTKSLAVAKYILEKRQNENGTVTPMQLIKLVYVAHGWTLGVFGTPLIDETVEAWQYGPVVPSVYRAVKQFRSQPVTSIPTANPYPFTDDEKKIMDMVARVYGPHDGIALSSATHQPNTPWSLSWNRCTNTPISNDVIEHFYKELYKHGGKHTAI